MKLCLDQISVRESAAVPRLNPDTGTEILTAGFFSEQLSGPVSGWRPGLGPERLSGRTQELEVASAVSGLDPAPVWTGGWCLELERLR